MSRADLIAESAMEYAQDRADALAELERIGWPQHPEAEAARRDHCLMLHAQALECERSIIALANQMIAERAA